LLYGGLQLFHYFHFFTYCFKIKFFSQQNKLILLLRNSLVELPTPSRISYIWNFGSLLGVCLISQIVRGLWLAAHYNCDTSVAFYRVDFIIRETIIGWFIRAFHSNGARIFFVFLYLHIARGLYYRSFTFTHVWIIGCSILFLTIGTAFLGYVLPWGQIRFWGATVITNLICVIPKLGTIIVNIFWGGFAVDNSSLTRFFTLHFLFPFIIAGIRGLHLFFLHLRGSNNPLGLGQRSDKLKFNPYFTWKDILGVLFVFQILLTLVTFNPWLLGDPENFIQANPYITPIHIQPEWYFLFAYAILRRIPNKLGGVVALVLSVAIFYTLPLINSRIGKRKIFIPLNKIFFWGLVNVIILLTWIGARPVENPYILTGQVLTTVYFIWFLGNRFSIRVWHKSI